MKFEMLVHGVPYGQDYWGPDFDRSYAAQFFHSPEDGLQYVVETRKVDGKNYCYYTYARYGNVLDCEGRSSSYVAVTYRFDMLYVDVKWVFWILETVFEKCIVGSIVEYSGTNYKFLCRSLKEKEEVMKKVKEDSIKLLQQSLHNNNLLTIDEAYIHKNYRQANLNITDCTEGNILSVLKQVSKVVATPNAPDVRDKRIMQLEDEKRQCQGEIEKLIEKLKSKIGGVKSYPEMESKINLKVLVHGVPLGQKFLGPDFIRSYAVQFYESPDKPDKDEKNQRDVAETRYVVETCKVDGKNYCYYTYAKYGNVLDYDGRGGSYVAITCRFEMLYADVRRIFQILETVFEKCVVGSIVEYSGTNYRFLCKSLEDKKDVLKKIEVDILGLLQLSVLNSKWLPIGDEFIHQGSKKVTRNITDCTESNVLNDLKQVSKVVATPNAPDERDKTIAQRNEEIAQLKVNLDAEKKGRRKDNEAWKKKIDDIKTDEKLIAENEQLQNDVLNSQHKVENYKLTLDKLRKKMRVSLGVILSLLALSLGGLAYLKFIAPQQLGQVTEGFVSQSDFDKLKNENEELKKALEDNDTSGQTKRLNDQIKSLEEKNTELFNQNVELSHKLDELKRSNDSLIAINSLLSEGEDKPTSGGNEKEVMVSAKALDINFLTMKDENANQPFVVGKSYKAKVVYRNNRNKKYEGTGNWKAEGFKMEETEDPAVVILTPLETEGKREITFTLPNDNNSVVRGNDRLSCTKGK